MVQFDLRTKLPPLENGDHLNRYEFERRYHASFHLKKAELIEGVVYMSAALGFKSHGQPHGQLSPGLGYMPVLPSVSPLAMHPPYALTSIATPNPMQFEGNPS